MANKMPAQPPAKPFLSDVWYNRLKWIAQIFLPAVGTLYFALAGSLGLPAAEQVVGAILAFDTFLGALLGVSTRQYNNSGARFDGALVMASNDNRLIHNLEIITPPDQLGQQKEIILEVKKGGPADVVDLDEDLDR